MNQTVDTRTVEMRFDNKNFESNVKQSMSTLDKLKRSLKLDGASSGLKEVERNSKKIEFKDLNRNIDGIGKRFSVLETIATGALLRIGAKAADLGTKLVKSLSIDQAVSGWNKYAEETTAVQTIMANLKDNAAKFVDEASKMEYVEGLLEKLMWFSDETSYNFTDMTGNIGKFIANGQDLDESVTAMQGIATWAAKSGQNAQTASRAMYNISQAMGVGAMTGVDWKSIEIANMATAEFKELAISVAVAKNKIKEGQVTVNNFRDSLAKKWFDKEVMMEVFKTYGGVAEIIHDYAVENDKASTEAIKDFKNNAKLAEQWGLEIDSIGFKAFMAAQEAKTFEEVMAATADAVSTKWSRFFKNIFGNYLEAKELWTNLSEDMWNIFAAPIDELNEIMSKWKKGFSTGGPVSVLEKAFRSGVLDNLESSFSYVSKEAAAQASSLDDSVYSIEQMEDGTSRLIKLIKKEDGTIERWYKHIYNPDSLLSGRDLLIGGFKNLMETFFTGYETEAGKEVLSIFQTIRAAFREIFYPEDDSTSLAKRLWDLTKRFKEFTDRIKPTEETINKIKNAFKGFFTIFKIGYKFVKAVVKPFRDIFSGLFAGNPSKGIINLANSMGTWIQKLEQYLDKGKKFEEVSTKIKNGLETISKTLTGLSLSDLIAKIRSDVTDFFKNFKFEKIFQTIGGWLQTINLRGVFETITTAFGAAVGFLKKIITEISQINTGELPEKLTPIQNFWITIKDFVKNIDFEKIFNTIINAFTSVIKSIKKVITEIGQVQTGKLTGALTPIQNFWIGLKEIFDSVKPVIPIIIDAFGKIAKVIANTIQKLSNTEDLSSQLGPFKNYIDGIKELFKGIKSLLIILSGPFKKISTFIGEFLASIADKVTASNHVTRSVNRSRKKSSEALDGVKDLIKGIIIFFSSVGKMLGKIASATGKIFATLGVIIKKFVENHSAEEIIQTLLKGGILVALIVIATRIKWTTEAIRELIEGLGDISFAIKRRLNVSMITSIFKSLAVLVLSIAAAITLMAVSVKQVGIGKVLAISGILLVFSSIPLIFAAIINKMTKDKSQLTTMVTSFKIFQTFILTIAAYLLLISTAFALFAKIKFDNTKVGWIGLIFASAVGVAILTAWAVTTFMNKAGKSAITSLAVFSGFMIAMAACLILVSRAFSIIAKSGIDAGMLVLAGFIFGAFMAAVTTVALVVTEYITKTKNRDTGKMISALAAMSGFMIAVSISLILLARAFKKFAEIKFENLEVGWISLIFAGFTLIVTGMVALGSILMKNAMSIAGVAVMAGFMITAAASLSLVALAFSKLSDDISPAQMGLALAIMLAFGAIVAVLAAIGAVLAGTGVGLAGMALVAAIITAIGFACLGAGAGIALFVNSISNLIETFIILMEATTKYGEQFIGSISAIIDSALDAIANSQEKLKNAAISVITAIAEAIIIGAPIISKALIVLLVVIMENVRDTIDVSTKILADTLAVATVALIDAMGDALRKNGPKLAKAFRNLLEACIEAALEAGIAIIEPFGALGKRAAQEMESWIPELRRAFEVIDEESDSVLDDIIEHTDTLGDSADGVLGSLLNLLSPGANNLINAEDTKKFFSELFPDIATIWGGKVAATSEAVKKETPEMQEALKNAFDAGYLDSLNSSYGYVTKAGAEQAIKDNPNMYAIQTLEDGTERLVKKVEKADGTIQTFYKTIYDSEAPTAMSDFVTTIKGPLGELEADMFPSGQDTGNNFITGIRSTFGDAEGTANDFAGIFSSILHHSTPDEGPMANDDQWAPDFVKVWCEGIRNNLGQVDASSNSMTERIKNGFMTALDYIRSLIDGGMSDELTIRPIMDLSDIQNGVEKLDYILGSRNGYSLSGTAGFTSSAAYSMRTPNSPMPVVAQPSNTNNTFNNTFNITNNDPNAVAEQVSRIMQKQVIRKQAVWAK